jgi:hypothetical protein
MPTGRRGQLSPFSKASRTQLSARDLDEVRAYHREWYDENKDAGVRARKTAQMRGYRAAKRTRTLTESSG